MSQSTPHPWLNEERPVQKGTGPVFLRRRDPFSRGGASPEQVQSDLACPTCDDLGLRDARENEPPARKLRPSPRKLDFFNLAESADLEECKYCCLVYHSLMGAGARIALHGYSLVDVVAQAGHPFYIQWDDSASGRRNIETFYGKDSPRLLHELGEACDISPDPNSEDVFQTIRQWIDQCETSHPECKSVSKIMPRRLLRIDPDDSVPLRLIEDSESRVPYAALSHCWGDSKGLTTTKESLEENRNGIRVSQLPKSFQDAVITARKLGLEYIWIDSLCIVQNDLSDWETEAAKMGDIYEGAFITIAAATASSDDDGFLSPTKERSEYLTHSVEFVVGGKEITVNVRQVHDFRISNSTEPLSLRGWTLQENYLSRRYLSFSSGVTFECRKLAACECSMGLYPDPFCPSPAYSFGRADRRPFQNLSAGETGPNRLYELWYYGVVTPYSNRSLSREGDCLPAISAIARKLETVLGQDKYLAGLWFNDLRRSLLWRGTQGTGAPTQSFVAPTWSWASVSTPISYELPSNYELPSKDAIFTMPYEVVEATCTPQGINTMGAVQCGHLRIRGCVIEAHFLAKSGTNECIIESTQSRKKAFSRIRVQNSLDTPIEEIQLPRNKLWRRSKTARRVQTPGNIQGSNVEIPILCLLVRHDEMSRSPTKVIRRYCILLAKSATNSRAYERLGIIQISAHGNVDGRVMHVVPLDNWLMVPVQKMKPVELLIV